VRWLLLCVTLATFVAGCPKPSPPPVTPSYDAAACTSTPAVCAYCAHMRQLGCPEGGDTPNGSSCEAVTENVQAVGYAAMDLACRTSKDSCAEVNRCR